MQRRAFLIGSVAGAGALAAVALAGVLRGGSTTNRPSEGAASNPRQQVRARNVIVVLLDDMRHDEAEHLVHLRRVAASGVEFHEARQPTPLCSPARAGYLTGRLAVGPHGQGLVAQWQPFGELENDTVAVWLSQVGYWTAHLGKYFTHLQSDARPGWSRWRGTVGEQAVLGVDYRVGTSDREPPAAGPGSGGSIIEPDEHQEVFFAGELLDAVAEGQRRGAPFFISWCPNSPHTPLDATTANAGVWSDMTWSELPGTKERLTASDDGRPSWMRELPQPSEDEIAAMDEVQRKRLSELSDVDDTIGVLWDHLLETGAIDDTLVIITSDNGVPLLEHRLPSVTKNAPYDCCAKVPLVMAGAGLVHQVVDVPVLASQDVAATLVDVAGAEPTTPLDGVSLLDVADDPAAYRARGTLGHRSSEAGVPGLGLPTAWSWVERRDDRLYKYIRYEGTDEVELFDLDADPGELDNVAASAPDLVGSFDQAIDAALAGG